jgi:glucosamine-6-phosphate deaminase
VGSYSLSVVDSYEQMSAEAADIVQGTVEGRPEAAITVPTGQTPLGMYEELVRRVRAGTLNLDQAQIFCLDDYLGQSRHDEASLTRWLFEAFLTPAGIPEGNIHLIPATAGDPDAGAESYEADIADLGGLELAVVGLGPNGHIAFNEPGSPPNSRTRVVELTKRSREQSSAYWEGEAQIPERAITMGLGTILSARKIVLIVSGAAKAEVVRRSLEEEPTLDVPGSWLQQAGERLHVILDREAASALTNAR